MQKETVRVRAQKKQKLVDGILKDAEPVVNRMKELAGKMNGMVELHGNPADPPDEHLLPAVQDGI